MVVRFRRKVRKLRGRTRTMGWGRIGQHRKTGSKGGRGAAGMLKHKESWMRKYAPGWIGKHGFTSPYEKKEKVYEINLLQLDELVEELASKGVLKEDSGKPIIELDKLGFTKLLGTGRISRPIKVVVKEASEKAIEKVKSVGGEVITEG
ncbi:50S ribosomal protein L15 [Fervidicoccus fontis]|jgi:large subunit ribosomal protein L15|uniref:Large ribosomal subunit protein uL15 n=2 Tax=Fervidicoccus fontis TaxID=683846 RepID=I0A0I1_FERFK|nr:uL15 family ribosomal protein [Fervidicoccus fontis]AFH42488.1 50S ribosomal protein L15P [Fervidicoccus fontis Kam940]MBE9391101.1 50S ribosomal protein L15 [Fervidicoccus fontis]PMB75713.1 MAG: 50S ribosomal protein L15 [Fervidicoccus fontis]PMB78099.1 MAG: 50S ribosomal protein L15 [Fervidicoccus fontis]HEW64165.1 50S ribosomal protein L15 [Fervidicoccus fontis]